MSTTTQITDTTALKEYIGKLEDDTHQAVIKEGIKMESVANINGQEVKVTVTPQANSNRRPYTLFYVAGKRKPRKAIVNVLIPS